MAITIAELIKKRDDIKAKKEALYDLETSVGTITCSVPDAALVAEAWDMQDTSEGNKHLVFSCCVDPNLSAKELLEAYDCSEPFDIVTEIFQAGEVAKIAGHLLKLAGFNGNVTSKLHQSVKK